MRNWLSYSLMPVTSIHIAGSLWVTLTMVRLAELMTVSVVLKEMMQPDSMMLHKIFFFCQHVESPTRYRHGCVPSALNFVFTSNEYDIGEVIFWGHLVKVTMWSYHGKWL